MNKLYYKDINETLYTENLKNGLSINMVPKNDFNKTYVVLSVKYGSLNNSFCLNGEFNDFPAGIAHFLEHKLFALKDGTDALNLFNELGANANAYTTYGRTAYLFSSTSNTLECLKILLNFVFNPYFTDENVEKEKGIIEQEINMYKDYPDWVSQTALLNNMYSNNSVRDDVLGTKETISKITKELLYDCYNTFYKPCNMQLFIIGKFDKDTFLEEIKKIDSNQDLEKPISRFYQDEKKVVREQILHFNVYMSKLNFGIKLTNEKRSNQLKFELSISLLLTLLFGESSKIYQELLKEGIINESFDVYGNHEETFDYISLEGDSNNPYLLKDKLIGIFSSLDNFKINEEDFRRTKKSLIGKFISLFNSLESVANLFTRYSFMSMDIFKIIPTLKEITINDLYEIIPLIKDENISYCITLPK